VTQERYIPAAGHAALTRFYDAGVRVTMREGLWRPLMISQVAAARPATVLDLGCGTGTLTVPLAAALPDAEVLGIDGDDEVLALAGRKPGAERVTWARGLVDALPYADGSVDVVVSSLVFHHLPVATKQAALREAHRVLRPGGRLLVADWGPPRNVVLSAAYVALQCLDGFATTSDNRHGRLRQRIVDAGFSRPTILRHVPTVLGSFEVLGSVRD
jgi:ubiquinone/menaquinone biosynthesis C-methylase UbiE